MFIGSLIGAAADNYDASTDIHDPSTKKEL